MLTMASLISAAKSLSESTRNLALKINQKVINIAKYLSPEKMQAQMGATGASVDEMIDSKNQSFEVRRWIDIAVVEGNC